MDKGHKVRPPGADWLMAEIRRMGDFYDPWGTAMEWFFAVAHVLWHHTAEEIPASWQYRHAPGPEFCAPSALRDDSYPEQVIMDHWPTLSIFSPDREPGEALLYVGRVLDRYTSWLRLAGRDY